MSQLHHLSRQDIKALTEARLTFGPRGRAMDTSTSLQFSLDHARAREAVLSELDVPRIQKALKAAGLDSQTVTSAAGTRDIFIRRPDLGRLLPEATAETLHNESPLDVALLLADGLSAIAAALNGPAFVTALSKRLLARGLTIGKIVCARQARVAIGDRVAQALGAETVVVALGERPGLSAADSLGVYITHRPKATTQDSARNCISNIREAGTNVVDAAEQAEQLIVAMRETGLSGVELSMARAENTLTSQSD
ncbi:ethanolamine ammonia-lyase subunit EutC [Marimonas lutisalis]|uniref:ethanolamine ammonia-lyase subunit EutC n=1 Tax=Marimonas lutisalis TaxID=2545756 RepID=UPI0010F4C26B|nr:ethanolamine ammonia-lyase subunit EutC [Marimonas lutisalis]